VSAARLLTVGDRAFLVETTTAAPHDLAAAITASSWRDRVVEVVPAASTVLLVAVDSADVVALRAAVLDLLAGGVEASATSRGRLVEIAVTYDGIDLAAVSDATGLAVDDVVAAHSGADHVVEFFGFAPGFAYIGGVPDELHLPRRSDPRVRIDAGTVAIAGGQTVIYPGGTPGGWHLIGHTDAVLWDVDASPPNLIAIGDTVRFRATDVLE
jgi:5-oxoprolinase (ATP-hydrolysing) subunit B